MFFCGFPRPGSVPGFGRSPSGARQAGVFHGPVFPSHRVLAGPALCFGPVAPCGVAGQVLEQVCPGGLEFLAVQPQSQEPAPEGVCRVVRDRPCGAGCAYRQGLMAYGHAKLYVGFYLPGVERAVEGPELDGAFLPHRMQVQQVVAAPVVVVVSVVLPVPVVIPKPSQFLGCGGPSPVEYLQEVGVYFLAPSFPSLRAYLQGLGEQVFLGVYYVHQVSQGLGGMLSKSDVYVDAAGGMCLCPGLPERPDDGLNQLDIVIVADRGNEFRSLVERALDAGIAHEFPLSSVHTGDRPSVVGTAGVLHPSPVADGVGGEGLGYYLCGLLSRDTVHLYFESECLCFHGGVLLSPGGGFSRPARTGPVFPAGGTYIAPGGPEVKITSGVVFASFRITRRAL